MRQYQMISADSHILEPPDLWQTRVSKKYRDRAPRVTRLELGDAWIIEGVAEPMNFGFNQCASDPPEQCSRWIQWEDCRPGAHDPAARLPDLDRDSVDADVLYPTPGLSNAIYWNTQDPEFHLHCVRAYNDWLSEFCGYAPDRLIGLAMMPNVGADAAVEELRRAVALPGIRGVMIGQFPHGGVDLSPDDDPFWAEAEAANVAVSIHISLATPPGALTLRRKAGGADRFINVPGTASDFIISGVFDRFPALNIVFAEVECAWIPCLKEQMDITYRRRLMWPGLKLNHTPSYYLEKNIYCAFINDPFGVKSRHAIGVSQMLWSSDFPHGATTWPNSRAINDQTFSGVPEDERHAILAGNTARLYGLAKG